MKKIDPDSFTVQEFRETDEPLVLICSIRPESGDVMYSLYNIDEVDGFMESFKKDFPDWIHMRKSSGGAIAERRRKFGLSEEYE